MPKIIHSLPLQYGHLCKADTWFSHFGARIKEVWLYVQWYSVIYVSHDLFLNGAVKRQKRLACFFSFKWSEMVIQVHESQIVYHHSMVYHWNSKQYDVTVFYVLP